MPHAPLPETAQPQQVALGAPAQSVPTFGQLVRVASSNRLRAFNGTSAWNTIGAPPTGNVSMLNRHPSGSYLLVRNVGTSGDLWHSPDGDEWSIVLEHTANVGVFGYDIGGDGTIRAVMGNTAAPPNGQNTQPCTIHKSTDGGATWELEFTLPPWDGANNRNRRPRIAYPPITADKWNPLRVFLMTAENTRVITVDGGASWTVGGADAIPGDSSLIGATQFMGASRIIYMRGLSSGIFYSDDMAGSWTAATFSDTIGAVAEALAVYRNAAGVRGVASIRRPSTTQSDIYLTENNGGFWRKIGELTFLAPSVAYDGVNRIAATANASTDVRAIQNALAPSPLIEDITFDAGASPGAGARQFMVYK
jgi:hypothetical protein